MVLLLCGVVLARVVLGMMFARRRPLQSSPLAVRRRIAHNDSPRYARCAPKPAWVVAAVVRLKALSPDLGCRSLATLFNRRYRQHGMSVSKSYVAALVLKHQRQIAQARRDIRARPARCVARNVVWALDLTEINSQGQQRIPVLAMIDHGTRACVALQSLHDLSTISMLECVLRTIRRYGKPTAIRSDNGPQFRSWLFRLALRVLGIRQQRTEPYCPWQNGRVERFFGTLKSSLAKIIAPPVIHAQFMLDEFRCFYNHIRPHAGLDEQTPAEAWAGRATRIAPDKEPLRFEAWDGVLTGDFYPP